jgi:hypothetical protein
VVDAQLRTTPIFRREVRNITLISNVLSVRGGYQAVTICHVSFDLLRGLHVDDCVFDG